MRNNRINRSRTILFSFCAVENTKETTLIHGKHVGLESISGQPVILSEGRYNLRKLHEIPVHLMRNKRWNELRVKITSISSA